MTAKGSHSAEDLCIEQLADELAEMREDRDSYRLLAHLAIGQIADLTKERDRISARYLTLLEQHRRGRDRGVLPTFSDMPSEMSAQPTDLHS